ncbi:MAG: exodeoxyribonuclease VII large subunit [Gammaproteobacteria bacterium]|nr:exodeoxyribonuclease VII large subunit [Gammaproteobacteria bacterium]
MVKNEFENRDVYNVTRLNREVRAVLEGSFPLLWVQGEISNLARPASGHIYFSLKDKHSQVRCAMFRNRMRSIKFVPENGMEILARANVGLYEGRGEFQLIMEHIEPAGEGALQRAFEELKQRLNEEGLFAEEHKKPLPAFPKSIGIITSPSGAAIRDILQVLRRRYPLAEVVIYPVPVQGEGSAEKIIHALQEANRRYECDVLILSRGGGSLEDLWSFNEENLARAIHSSSLPVVSGVGHEIDFTIADFVADQRAPTPSAAAELVSPDCRELLNSIEQSASGLERIIQTKLSNIGQTLYQLEKRLPHPERRLQLISQRLDETSIRLQQAIKGELAHKRNTLLQTSSELNNFNPLQMLTMKRDKCQHLFEKMQSRISYLLEHANQRMQHLNHALHTISPLATLERGYAIVTHGQQNQIVRDAEQIQSGDIIRTRLARGEIEARVESLKKAD